MAKFLTNHSTIKQRRFTKLDVPSQMKVARAIKHARALNVLPSWSYLKSYHKKPLKSIQEDLNEASDIHIDL